MCVERPAQLDATIGVVSQWVVDLVNSDTITSGYLFGSAVNEDGKRFQSITSDIDLVVVVDWDSIAIMDRVKRLQDLSRAKFKLEQDLLALLERSDAVKTIVSLIPVSDWERDQGVHKDGHSAVMDCTQVLDLTSREIRDRISTKGVERILPESHRACLQFVQKQRAAFLNISANRSRALEIRPHDDPVPKELLRNFAIATADANAEGPTQTDIARGLEALSLFVNKLDRTEPEFINFSEWLGVKRGARGDVPPIISETHYLIALEGIYDAIRQRRSPPDRRVKVGFPDGIRADLARCRVALEKVNGQPPGVLTIWPATTVAIEKLVASLLYAAEHYDEPTSRFHGQSPETISDFLDRGYKGTQNVACIRAGVDEHAMRMITRMQGYWLPSLENIVASSLSNFLTLCHLSVLQELLHLLAGFDFLQKLIPANIEPWIYESSSSDVYRQAFAIEQPLAYAKVCALCGVRLENYRFYWGPESEVIKSARRRDGDPVTGTWIDKYLYAQNELKSLKEGFTETFGYTEDVSIIKVIDSSGKEHF
jgi:hypothetical protein